MYAPPPVLFEDKIYLKFLTYDETIGLKLKKYSSNDSLIHFTDIENYQYLEKDYGIGIIRISKKEGYPSQVIQLSNTKWGALTIYLDAIYTFKEFLEDFNILNELKRKIPLSKRDYRMVFFYQTPKDTLQAVKDNGNNFYLVKEELQTYEMALLAVSKNTDNIQFVRKDLQSEFIVNFVMKKECDYIEFIREDLQTLEMAREIMKETPYNKKYIRKDLLDKYYCRHK